MGSLGQAQNDTESIAQFMQRLSQATNIFISPEDPTGKEQTYKWITVSIQHLRITDYAILFNENIRKWLLLNFVFYLFSLFLFSGFFGELLMLVCQTFTMSDLVMLLHGQHQPLGRIQPQLSQFFTQNYLNGREPTDENIAVSDTY